MISLELLAGAGWSLLSYKRNGFDAAMAVEDDKDKDTIRMHEENNKRSEYSFRIMIHWNVLLGRLITFISALFAKILVQPIDLKHRVRETPRADLSLLLIDIVRTLCSTVMFENIVCIWQESRCITWKHLAITDILRKDLVLRLRVHIWEHNSNCFVSCNNSCGPDPNHIWPHGTIKDAVCAWKITIHCQLWTVWGLVLFQPYALTLVSHPFTTRGKVDASMSWLPSFNCFLFGMNSIEAWQINIDRLQHMELSTAVAQSPREFLLYDYEEDDEEWAPAAQHRIIRVCCPS